MHILGPFGAYYGHLACILCSFGNLVVIWYIFPVLVYCITKNLATLIESLVFGNRFFFSRMRRLLKEKRWQLIKKGGGLKNEVCHFKW
jgi:threonine aldolase